MSRRKLNLSIAQEVFDRPPSYYNCPHFDKKGRMLSFCACPELPDYSGNITAAWLVHREMKGRSFTDRRTYLQAIQEVQADRLREKAEADPPLQEGAMIAWPDVLLFLEPIDICLAARRVVAVHRDKKLREREG